MSAARPPLLFSGYNIASGQTVTVTFDVQINGNISVSQIVNRAFVNSFASPAPLEAAATNYVLLPERSRVAGWVRNDLPGTGNINGAYPGIAGVPITLYTDPNGDGNPADGVIVASVNTDTNGFFELGYFLSNRYVILQSDLFNWRSTADSDGGNPNLISFTSISGVNYTNNIFLDTRLAMINGQVRLDTDGDGDLNDPDNGLAGVTITLFSDPNGDGNPADGIAVSSRVSNASGNFVFMNVNTGNFVLVESDLPGMFSTADSDGMNDNRISVYLPGGIDSTNHVFLDANSGLTITKVSNPPGIWFPGMEARYTITVANTGSYTHASVNISDLLGDGLSYVPGSTRISGYNSVIVMIYTNIGTNTFSPPSGVSQVEYLVVAGGGGGGGIASGNTGGAGGGGAGGYLTNVGGTGYPVSSTQIYAVVVGGGGSGGVGSSSPGGNGGNSSFHTIIAFGGGGGASVGNNNGESGGSGGGGRLNSSGLGGSGTSGQGLSGGNGASSGSSAGGGGGAFSTGFNGNTTGVGGSGGIGRTNNISGASISYAGGGGGGAYAANGGSGGAGGGGSAPNARGAGGSGAAHTGGGGAGASGSASGNAFDGGSGGSGIVIIRYNDPNFGVPPNLLSGISIAPGVTITITLTAQVASAVSGVTNTACVVTDVLTNGLCTTVVNSVDPEADPDRISGQVRFDVDGDGNLADPDFGIQGVSLQLYSDPNGDGNPADGSLQDSTVTDFNGYYIFGNLVVGNYVVVQVDLPGYTSTGDSQGGNDNRIAVNLPGGVDSRDNDFLDWTISGLTIKKTSDAGDVVVPGERLVYSIIVSNTRNVAASGVRIQDHLPNGIVYVPSSTWVVIDGIVVTNSVRDVFESRAYTNQDGNIRWIKDWTESNDTGGALSGSIVVTNDFGPLRLRLSNLNRWIHRSADISGGEYATLSYYYRRQSLENNEFVTVEISTNNANPWIEIARHGFVSGGASSQSDSSYQFVSHDIQAYATTNTTIRFRTAPSGNMNNADFVWFDDVSIDFGYSASIATGTFNPPVIVTNQTLAPGGFIAISFTTEVFIADTLVNTAIVFTLTDTNGLRSYSSNFVGIISMTQGVVVAEADDLAVHVGWSAYVDDGGDVSKEYDVMFVDDAVVGFYPGLTSRWAWAATIQDRGFKDAGGAGRPSPVNLGGSMRFYRASFKGTWGINKTPRYASREVYVSKSIRLKEGENFISLFMVPDKNRLDYIFGTNQLPSGSSMAASTRIEWYAPTAQSEATNVVWLSSGGVWQYAEGGIANHMPLPLNQGFNLIVPPGHGDRDLVLIGRIPTNASVSTGHVVPIVANENYNIVSYNVPYRMRLIDSGLKEAGFAGVGTAQAVNPNNSDELRILRKGGGSLQSPQYRILLNPGGQFQFWTGGSGTANNFILEPDDALIIYTKKSKTNFTWNVGIPYPVPSVYMNP